MAKEPKFPKAQDGDSITRNGPRSLRAKLRSAAKAIGFEEVAGSSDEEFESGIREHAQTGSVQHIGRQARLSAPESND